MKTQLPRPKEAGVQKGALQWCEARRIPAFRRNVVAMVGEYKGRRRFVRAGSPGMSDLWGLIPARTMDPGPPIYTDTAAVLAYQLHRDPPAFARHWEAEAKRPGERPTLAQVEWLLRMNDLTGAAFWFDGVGIFERVMLCLIAGGRVEYLDTTRRYGKAEGPSGDFDILWPE